MSLLPAGIDHLEQSYRRPVQQLVRSKQFNFLLFWAFHIVLGLGATRSPSLVPTMHALVTMIFCVSVAGSRASLTRVAYTTIYIVGAELFWRMTEARVFWETGKYAVVLVMVIALLRSRSTRIPALPLFYFLLLLPSSILTLDQFSIGRARELISGNLSGPLTLFVSCWFFSYIRFNRAQYQELLSFFVAPVLSIVTYISLNILTSERIIWTNDSNYQTSGGFGPNQISTILGLAIFIVWIMFTLVSVGSKFSRLIIFVIGIWFIVQGLLTFSRGGILTAIVAITIYSIYLLPHPKQRIRFIYATAFIASILYFILIPQLETFTSGYLETRYKDMSSSGREDIIETELKLFTLNPVFGVGPGVGNTVRKAASHTEFSRMLAEHGMLGILSLFLLVILVIRMHFSSKNSSSRGIRDGFAAWALISMTHAAMRVAAIPFMAGLSLAEIELDE